MGQRKDSRGNFWDWKKDDYANNAYTNFLRLMHAQGDTWA